MRQPLPSTYHVHDFYLPGEVVPLLKSQVQARVGGHYPTRPMAGWLMTYAKLAADGSLVETVDRDRHVVEAARELGKIDWQPYVKGGFWNDTHDEQTIVGVPTLLEFHDQHTELAKAHRKVGFFTAGHLFDRKDPSSWMLYTDRVPTERELDASDRFWTIATMLKGMVRPLGLSAHGKMALSPCRSRIIWCQVSQAAVCELPKNPDATLEPMELAVRGAQLPIELLRKGMVGRRACGACSCPPWACEGLLRKSGEDGKPQPLPGETESQASFEGERIDQFETELDDLITILETQFFLSREDATNYLARFFRRSARNGRYRHDRASRRDAGADPDGSAGQGNRKRG